MINIIPAPLKAEFREGEFSLSGDTVLICVNESIGKILADTVRDETGIELQTEQRSGSRSITLQKTEEQALGDEGYRMIITPDGIRITSQGEAGLFYGAQSLIQLLAGRRINIPCMEITDKPRFGYRGYMLDVVRHFFSPDQLKRVIDLCSLLKLNVLHLHLSDDQGWRIEIKNYPRLTEYGSKRSGTVIKGVSDNVPVNGFYTRDEIRDLVSYAEKRFIKIIPEIDFPGHSQALIACYPELSCEGRTMQVSEKIGPSVDILCAGNERSYEILSGIMNEICTIFDSNLVHLGGDEALKTRWYACPRCQDRMKREGLRDEEELQAYMTNRIIEELARLGRRAVVWNESIKADNLDPSAVCQQWLDKKKTLTVTAVNSGRQVIISDFFNYYLDYPYGMTSLKKTYNFEPVYKGIKGHMQNNVIGVEAPLWTEFISDMKTLEYQTFPRLAAVCETAWTDPVNKDYEGFKRRLCVLNRLLDSFGVNYASEDETDITGPAAVFQFIKHFSRAFSLKEFVGLIRMMKIKKK